MAKEPEQTHPRRDQPPPREQPLKELNDEPEKEPDNKR